MPVMKYLHCNYCMYTCGFRINANLVKEGSFRINAKLVKEELNTRSNIIISTVKTNDMIKKVCH